MPIIIDTNRAGDFSVPLFGKAPLILAWINRKSVRVAVGGLLLRELMRTPLGNLILEWERSGLLVRIPCQRVDAKTHVVDQIVLQSDDPHVLALALEAGAFLAYTEDEGLIKDLKNKNIIISKRKIIKTTTSDRNCAALLARFGG